MPAPTAADIMDRLDEIHALNVAQIERLTALETALSKLSERPAAPVVASGGGSGGAGSDSGAGPGPSGVIWAAISRWRRSLSCMRFISSAFQPGMRRSWGFAMAVAWSKQHDFVASTIVGVSKEAHLPEIFAAADLVLSDDVMKAIDKVSKEIRYPMG